MILLDSLSRLKALPFGLFVAMQDKRFKAIDPWLVNDDVSTLRIGPSSIPNIMELYKHANSKSFATLTCWVLT